MQFKTRSEARKHAKEIGGKVKDLGVFAVPRWEVKTEVKSSDILKNALDLLQNGAETFACIAISTAIGKSINVRYISAYSISKYKCSHYFLKYRPKDHQAREKQLNNGGGWWPQDDKAIRIKYLKKAIADALANND